MTCCPTCGQALPADQFNFDVATGILMARGQFVTLPRREAEVLDILLSKRGRQVSKTWLFEQIYRRGDEPETENVVESHVSKLRKKILPLGLVIRSERFKGYALTIGAKAVQE